MTTDETLDAAPWVAVSGFAARDLRPLGASVSLPLLHETLTARGESALVATTGRRGEAGFHLVAPYSWHMARRWMESWNALPGWRTYTGREEDGLPRFVAAEERGRNEDA